MNTPELDRLVARLVHSFEGETNVGLRRREVTRDLGDYARSEADWKELVNFRSDHYTRNLVHRDKSFELLVLCWGPGQESPIHNHEGQDCWMAILDGDIEEVRFSMPAAGHTGPLDPLGSNVFRTGEVGFIQDQMGLHLVRTASPRHAGVSLHLYAAPYDECNVYCPETGKITRKRLVNDTVRGRATGRTGARIP